MHCAPLRSTTLALVALLTVGVGLPAAPVNADSAYTDPANNVRFQVPDTWKTAGPAADIADGNSIIISPTSWTTTNPAGTFGISASGTWLLATFLWWRATA